MSDAAPSTRPPSPHAPRVVRLVAAWILVGGIAKLAAGTPTGLPIVLLDLADRVGLGLLTAFRLVVAIELAVGLLALLRPRLGHVPLGGLLAAFVTVLLVEIGHGTETCGCFGVGWHPPARLVLAIDVAAVLALAWAWSRRPADPPRRSRLVCVATALVVLVAVALPWLGPRLPFASGAADTGKAWSLTGEMPAEVELAPRSWIGTPLVETPLGRWLDPRLVPEDATLILYRVTCGHCGTYLAELAEARAAGGSAGDERRPLVLVEVPAPGVRPGARGSIETLPAGRRIRLPRGPRWVVSVPWEVEVRSAVVVAARRTG